MLVNLYTKQHINSLNELNSKGRITNKRLYVKLHMMDIADFFLEKYDLFVNMAQEKVKRPEGAEYPIWCSISKKNCMKPDKGSVVYALKVPHEEVIYFSSIKWDYVLNNLYIGIDKEEEDKFNKNLEKAGLEKFQMVHGKHRGTSFEKDIINSWKRIFDIDDFDEFSVQANIWEIKEEWIRHIIYQEDDFFEITKDMGDDLAFHKNLWLKKKLKAT